MVISRLKLAFFTLFAGLSLTAQEIYIINNSNELKILEVSNLSITDLLTVDEATYGTLQDIAFNPEGRLFATTSFNQIIEIDLLTQQVSVIFDLPAGDSYPGLGANANNELVTSKFLIRELFSYNIDTGEFTLVETGISTPGDFSYYKGNLVYPSFFNDFIKSYDGNTIREVGCSVPLIFGFVNAFEDCETNAMYAFDEDANIYLYTLGSTDYELIGSILNETGSIFGAATLTEYMASACPLETINTVDCTLAISEFNPFGIELRSNPVAENILLRVANPIGPLYFSIINLQGVQVKTGPLSDNQIPVDDLASGWYFLKMKDDRGREVFTEKVIKE